MILIQNISQMEKYLQNRLNPNTRHIIKMQHLLDQYDRQNQVLNRQVIQLLQENKTLRMDRLRKWENVGEISQYNRLEAQTKSAIRKKDQDLQRVERRARVSNSIEKKEQATAEKSPPAHEKKQPIESPPEMIMSFRPSPEVEGKASSVGKKSRGSPQRIVEPESVVTPAPSDVIPQAFIKMKQSRQSTPRRNKTPQQNMSSTSIKEDLRVEMVDTEPMQKLEEPKLDRRDDTLSRRSHSKHKLPPSPQITPSHSESGLKSASQLMSNKVLPISEIALGGGTESISKKIHQSAGGGRGRGRDRGTGEKKRSFIKMVSVSKTKGVGMDPEGRGGC